MIFKVCVPQFLDCVFFILLFLHVAYLGNHGVIRFSCFVCLFVRSFDGMQVFTFSSKKSTHFQLMFRFIQGVTALGLVAALALVVALTELSIQDLFACILAFIPTGWAILCVSLIAYSSLVYLCVYIYNFNKINLNLITWV